MGAFSFSERRRTAPETVRTGDDPVGRHADAGGIRRDAVAEGLP